MIRREPGTDNRDVKEPTGRDDRRYREDCTDALRDHSLAGRAAGGWMPAGTTCGPCPSSCRPGLADVAQVLSPSQIQIDGWLGARIAANEKNRLLVVDTEPLLAGYRKRPGSHPWIGEHVGKWLHAATLAWAYTGDAALKAKLDRVAADLIACQEPDGYLGTYVPGKRFGLYQGADWDVWSHKYNLIGLLTYYQYTGNQPAPRLLPEDGRPADRHVPGEEEHPRGRNPRRHGGDQRPRADRLALPVHRRPPLSRLRLGTSSSRGTSRAGRPLLASFRAGKGVNKTANGKAYEMLSNLVGLCELARATGDRGLLEPVLKRVEGHRGEPALHHRQRQRGRAFPGRSRAAQPERGEHLRDLRDDHVDPAQPAAPAAHRRSEVRR